MPTRPRVTLIADEGDVNLLLMGSRFAQTQVINFPGGKGTRVRPAK